MGQGKVTLSIPSRVWSSKGLKGFLGMEVESRGRVLNPAPENLIAAHKQIRSAQAPPSISELQGRDRWLGAPRYLIEEAGIFGASDAGEVDGARELGSSE